MSRENHIYEPDWSGRTDQLCSVNKPVIKKDALALVTGKPVYVDDLAPKDCLIVKEPACQCNRKIREKDGSRACSGH